MQTNKGVDVRKHTVSATIFVAILLLVLVATTGLGSADSQSGPRAQVCDIEGFDIWAGQVWDQARWRRGAPPHRIRRIERRKLKCKPIRSRRRMQEFWQEVKHDYNVTRKARFWGAKYRHYEYPDGSHWAVPYPIAWCESGGNYYSNEQGPLPSGAYGLVPPFPQYMSAKEQDEVAYNLFLEKGEEPWAPYEGECAYR